VDLDQHVRPIPFDHGTPPRQHLALGAFDVTADEVHAIEMLRRAEPVQRHRMRGLMADPDRPDVIAPDRAGGVLVDHRVRTSEPAVHLHRRHEADVFLDVRDGDVELPQVAQPMHRDDVAQDRKAEFSGLEGINRALVGKARHDERMASVARADVQTYIGWTNHIFQK